jgi:hypothetical protein
MLNASVDYQLDLENQWQWFNIPLRISQFSAVFAVCFITRVGLSPSPPPSPLLVHHKINNLQ